MSREPSWFHVAAHTGMLVHNLFVKLLVWSLMSFWKSTTQQHVITNNFFVIPFFKNKLHKNFFLCWFEKQLFSSVFKHFLNFFLVNPLGTCKGVLFSGSGFIIVVYSFPKHCIPLQAFVRIVPSFQEHFTESFRMAASEFGCI